MNPRTEEALAFIYIAQNVRDDRRLGVLIEDMKNSGYEQEVEQLESQGYIERRKEKAYYNLEGVITTDQGIEYASKIVKQRLEKTRPDLEKLYESLPPRFLIWLWKEIISMNNEDEVYCCIKPFHADHFGISDISDTEKERFLCLLNDSSIKELRNGLFERLVKSGLAVKVHSYALTKGGKMRELKYVLPKEVRELFGERLHRKRIGGSYAVFPEDKNWLHRFWHLSPFDDKKIKSFKIEKASLRSLDRKSGLNVEEKVIKELENKSLMQDEGDHWVVLDPRGFLKEWGKRFFLPLVEFLLEKKKLIKIVLKKSVIGYNKKQKATIMALGLKKPNSFSIKKKTPSIEGMIRKVSHLVEVEEI